MDIEIFSLLAEAANMYMHNLQKAGDDFLRLADREISLGIKDVCPLLAKEERAQCERLRYLMKKLNDIDFDALTNLLLATQGTCLAIAENERQGIGGGNGDWYSVLCEFESRISADVHFLNGIVSTAKHVWHERQAEKFPEYNEIYEKLDAFINCGEKCLNMYFDAHETVHDFIVSRMPVCPPPTE